MHLLIKSQSHCTFTDYSKSDQKVQNGYAPAVWTQDRL